VRVAIGEVELAYRLGWAKEHVEPVVSVAKKKCKGCKHWRKHDEWGKCMQRTDGDRERDCEGWAAKASTAGLSDTPLTVGFGIKMYCQSCYWWQQGLCYRVPQTFEKRRDDYCGEWRHRRWFKAEDETETTPLPRERCRTCKYWRLVKFEKYPEDRPFQERHPLGARGKCGKRVRPCCDEGDWQTRANTPCDCGQWQDRRKV